LLIGMAAAGARIYMKHKNKRGVQE